MDIRCFEVPIIHDSFVKFGRSSKGENYREHAVPRVVLRRACLQCTMARRQLKRWLWR